MASAAKPTDPARPPGSFVRDLFIPTPKLYGLPILIDTNIVVFLVMALSGLGVMSFDRDDLLVWGANFRPAIHGIGMFRLITSQFVHGGLIHLANNLYGLLFAGMFLTPVALNGRLIASYLLCGLGGSIASVLAHPATVSVGASGAIFGLFGILLTLVLFGDARLAEARKFIFINAGIFVELNLLVVPTVNLTATPSAVLTGQSVTVSWTSSNATMCMASGDPAFSGTVALSGSVTIKPTTAGTLMLTLSCSGAGGMLTKNQSVTVSAATATGGASHGGGGSLDLLTVVGLGLVAFRRRRASGARMPSWRRFESVRARESSQNFRRGLSASVAHRQQFEPPTNGN